MKKRWIAVVLSIVLLISGLPSARAIVPLCFVAMNDTIPMTLKGGAAPYYTSGVLYLPYTAFNISPNGVGAFYSSEKNSFLMFNANETLVFDLENDVYTDKQDKEYSVDVVFRSGMLYVPAKVASHFGLSVTMLNSRAGYPIIRFTNGEQVYDDGTFVAQAENLINRAAQEYEAELALQNPGEGQQTDVPMEEPPEERGPIEVYLAFKGDAVSQNTLDKLAEKEICAAFFLTEEQILMDTALVREIYADGHTVGITVAPEETDPAAALLRANDAMDRALFCRSVLAVLPAGVNVDLDSLHVVSEPVPITVEDLIASSQEPRLYLVDAGAPGVIASLVNANATVLKLRETTF